ncbi:hypothetical protein [Bartonella sp. HY406]|uniref:hypothetical protein n=1 Tax=Bartonella sp. HY406 TaxID=2979331 RepID=UPI0021C9E5E4|nr:hypothetical protein [Bartonella sp. HY406]UXN04614.1 hypothetical protein N6B01_06290 [Bartonella sp. HY406]
MWKNIIILLLILYICSENILSNTYFILIDKGYHIPEQSSIFKFKPIIMNNGSGDYWLLGEDDNNIYIVTDDGEKSIAKMDIYHQISSVLKQ